MSFCSANYRVDPRLPEYIETASGVEWSSKMHFCTDPSGRIEYFDAQHTAAVSTTETFPRQSNSSANHIMAICLSMAVLLASMSHSQQYVAGYHAVRGKLSADFLFGGSGTPEKFKIPRQRRRAECRLQTPLAQLMMRATVPTLIVYPSQWIIAR